MANAGKHPGGRPTKYKPEYCQQMIEFFSVEPTYEATKTITTKNGSIIEEPIERPTHLRFFSDFAASIGVNGDTIVEWTKVHPEFSAAYSRSKDLQKQHLITCGMLGLFNPIFAKFTACNITDMRDKQEVEHGGTVEHKVVLFGGNPANGDGSGSSKPGS